MPQLHSRALLEGMTVAPILSHLSPSTLQSLEIESNTIIHPQTMYWYPINVVIMFYSLWFIALLLHDYIFPSRLFFGKRWQGFGKYRRTMIVYLLSILVTFIALVVQLASLNVFHLHFTLSSMHMIRTAACLINVLYLFELIYREKMRFAMIMHHSLTMFAGAFIAVILDKTSDPSFFITANLWIFQATTEQFTFIALFGYRLQWRPTILRPLLRFASIQSLLLKLTSVISTMYVWNKYQRPESNSQGYIIGWDIVIWLAAIGLTITQFWGSWVVWVMGDSLEARYAEKRVMINSQQPQLSSSSSNSSSYNLEKNFKPTSSQIEEGQSAFELTEVLNKSGDSDQLASHIYGSHKFSESNGRSINFNEEARR